MDTKVYSREDLLFVVFDKPDEISAVFTSQQQAIEYIDCHKKLFPESNPGFILGVENKRMYNLYPVREEESRKIREIEQCSAVPTLSEIEVMKFLQEEGYEGYILILENFQHMILGVFKDMHSANLFSDEYLAVFPGHVIVFIEYCKNIIF